MIVTQICKFLSKKKSDIPTYVEFKNNKDKYRKYYIPSQRNKD